MKFTAASSTWGGNTSSGIGLPGKKKEGRGRTIGQLMTKRRPGISKARGMGAEFTWDAKYILGTWGDSGEIKSARGGEKKKKK